MRYARMSGRPSPYSGCPQDSSGAGPADLRKERAPICGGFVIGAGAGTGLGGAGKGGSGIGAGPGGTGLGGAGDGGLGSGLGIGEGEGAGMVAVNAVRKSAEQALMFIWLVPKPEVRDIPGRGSDQRERPDVFECPSNQGTAGSEPAPCLS